jgi:hypothetical protein
MRWPFHHGRQGLDLEAVLLAGFEQHGDVAGALGAVAEVVAHHQPFDVQALDQHALGEFLRRHGGEMGVEVFDDDAVDAGVGQRLSLSRRLAMRAAPCDRSPPAGEEFARMRLEGHHGRFQPEPVRRRARAPAMPGGRDGHRRSCRS